MATPEQRARRAAQRATAANVRKGRGYTPVVPRSTRAAVRHGREAYGDRLLASGERPPKGSPEGNNLASLAALARHGKADPKYLAFKDYWYHKNDEKNDADIEDESSGPDDNDEDSEELH